GTSQRYCGSGCPVTQPSLAGKGGGGLDGKSRLHVVPSCAVPAVVASIGSGARLHGRCPEVGGVGRVDSEGFARKSPAVPVAELGPGQTRSGDAAAGRERQAQAVDLSPVRN